LSLPYDGACAACNGAFLMMVLVLFCIGAFLMMVLVLLIIGAFLMMVLVLLFIGASLRIVPWRFFKQMYSYSVVFICW
jgi:hypothetical protein